MKTSRLLLFAASALTVLLAGCQKEEDRLVAPPEETISLNIALPDGPLTKTCFGERTGNMFPLLWSEGDKLSMNGTISNPLPAESAGGKKAAFTFRGSIRAPFNVLYPATSELDRVSFPTVQNYVEGSFDPQALPMYASSPSYSDASMNHLGTLLGFPFTGDGVTLKELVIMSLDGAVLSGSFALEKNETGAFTGSFESAEGATTATLDFPDGGMALSSEPVTAWIAIPSGVYSKGFTALAVDTGDNAMILSFFTKETHTLSPGRAVLFPATEFDPGEGVFLIDEPEDLILLSNESTAHPEVLLVKDIDMSGVADWTPIDGFNGLFNGAGHTISGLNDAVFNILKGEVRNLVVDASISSEKVILAGIVNEIADGARVVSCRTKGSIEYTGSAGGELCIGGIAAKCHGEILTSSVKVDLSISEEASAGETYVGGIAGQVTSDTRCFDFDGLCVEDGASIRIAYTSANANQLRAGGLFGYVNAPGMSFHNCANAALFDITVPEGINSSKMWIGGLVGHAISGNDGAIRFSSCTNDGAFSVDGKGGIGENSTVYRPCAVAGIVGKCQITGTDDSSQIILEECINNGSITLSSDTGSDSVYGRVTYLAGICGDAEAGSITDSACVNNGDITVTGYTDRFAIAGHIAIIWRSSGSKTILDVTGKGDTPVNTGMLKYNDGTRCTKHPVAGGVLGLLMGSVTPLEIDIKDCTNSGAIDRTTPIGAIFTISTNNEASAGGIVGNIGFQSSTTIDYSLIKGTIEHCVNNAQITINAYAGEKEAVEKTTNQSFLGGIVGFCRANSGPVIVKECTNSGYLRLTAGNAGGIVGRIQSNTIVTGSYNSDGPVYTLNTGRVGEVDLTLSTSYVSTGYSICGGIVGAMLFPNANDVSKIEYCHNAGDISGCHRASDGKGTIARPTVGGIIGQYDAGRAYAAVRYCKNSGHVRSYRAASSSSTWQYSGIISGSHVENPLGSGKYSRIMDCGIGGYISRTSWIVPTAEDGEYPFYNYIYCYLNLGGDYPPTTEEGTGFAEGCVVWDGVSKLPWEE